MVLKFLLKCEKRARTPSQTRGCTRASAAPSLLFTSFIRVWATETQLGAGGSLCEETIFVHIL